MRRPLITDAPRMRGNPIIRQRAARTSSPLRWMFAPAIAICLALMLAMGAKLVITGSF